ncbi:TadE/TadG family type IV pilus assembly protein [Paenibacillus sp. GCM10012307]|uniref:Pilus assembly protein n=1 Tax=Paenibacillus roseus TaxID=2798579 RepID=A0A934IY75_9BACL|nr:TadE family protein [Paenibacillus roseus]MBJ6361427.1 pilus assembly protein [Paenibacillus roseus]
MKRLRRLLRAENGSFTVEASMVFPLILVITVTSLFVSIYIYQNVIVYFTASKAAERTAFVWDNSYRSPATGLAPHGKYDSLYWRVKDDEMIESLFGIQRSDGQRGSHIALPAGTGLENSSSLVQRKLGNAANWVSGAYKGKVGLERSLWKKEVAVQLIHPVRISPLEWLLNNPEPHGRASSTITDPVEFIRSVDLVRYYADKFTSGSKDRDEAAAILSRRSSMQGGG